MAPPHLPSPLSSFFASHLGPSIVLINFLHPLLVTHQVPEITTVDRQRKPGGGQGGGISTVSPSGQPGPSEGSEESRTGCVDL